MDEPIYLLVSIIMSMIYCLVPVAGFILVVYLIVKAAIGSGKGNSATVSAVNNTETPLNIKKWLEDKKAEGKTTIDQLLAEFDRTEIKETPATQHVVPAKTPDSRLDQPAVRKESFGADSASILLYLGAGLLLFATFILVAFNWETFPDEVKSLIMIVVTLGFYVAGFTFLQFKKLTSAGYTFVSVGAVLLGFTGIGLWNFGLASITALTFEQYWLGYSILLLLANLGCLALLNKRRFVFLLLISIYSAFIALSFTLTQDDKFRIVIIAVLNLIFYLGDGLFGRYISIAKNAARGMNLVLNYIIILTVLANLAQIVTNSLEAVALAALAVPLIFQLVATLKDKTNLEPIVAIFNLPVIVGLMIVIMAPESSPLVYTIAYIIIQSLLCYGFCLFKLEKNTVWPNRLLPGIAVASIFTLISSLRGSGFDREVSAFIGFFAVAVNLAVIGNLFGYILVRLVSIPLGVITYFLGFALLGNYLPENMYNPETIGLGLLIPLSFYAIKLDLQRKSNKGIGVDILAFMGYAALAVLLTLFNWNYFLVTCVYLAGYFLIANLRYKNPQFAYGFYFSVLGFVLACSRLLELNAEYTLLLLTATGLLTKGITATLLGVIKEAYLVKSIGNIADLSLVLTIIILGLMFGAVLAAPSHIIALIVVLTTANIFVSLTRYRSMLDVIGLGAVLLAWNYAAFYSMSMQFFVVPLTIYLLTLSWLQIRKGNRALSLLTEAFAYFVQFSSLLLQSMVNADDLENILYGMVLIVLAVGAVIFGIYRRNKAAIGVAMVMLFLELLIRLYQVILAIPWWIYVGLFGMAIMGIAVYALSRKAETKVVSGGQ